ncbi:MAG TPA: hypothetical protein PKH33_02350 [bacterium]|nr:hypothetical protein [bacterium]
MNIDSIELLKCSIGLIFTIVTVFGGAFFIQKKLDPCANAADAIAQMVLIASAWFVASSVAFSIADSLNRLNLFTADFIFLAVAFAFRRDASLSDTNAPELKQTHFSPALGFIAAIAALFATASLVWAVSSPPPPWDAFVYHLSFSASWISNHEISPVTVPFGDQGGTYFPINVSLIYMRLMMATGQDFATNTVQWLFLIVAVLVVYRMSRSLGAPTSSSAAAASFLFFIPIILHQAVSSESDIVFSALFICAIHFLLEWADKPNNRAKLFFSFLSLGLFIGTKTIALVFTLLIALPLFIYFIATRREWFSLLWGAAVAAPLGGFVYIRNWLIAENPVFPLSVSLLGKEIFPGAYSRWTMNQSVFHTDSIQEWLSLLSSGYGLTALTFIAVCVAIALVKSRGHLRVKAIAVIPIIAFVICYCVIPYNKEVRFAFSAIMFSCVSVAWIGGQLGGKAQRIFYFIVLAAGFINIFASALSGGNSFHAQLAAHIAGLATKSNDIYAAMSPGAVILFIASIGISSVIVISICVGNIFRHGKIVLAFFTCLAAVSLLITSSAYPSYQYKYYTGFALGRSWYALHESTPGRSFRLAYTGTDINYGLSGPMLKNTFLHVPITEWDAPLFHDCLRIVKEEGRYSVPATDRIDFCRRKPNYNTWLERLKRERIDILHVSALHPNDLPHVKHDEAGFPIEREWADANPEIFKLAYMNSQARIYLLALGN